MKPVIAMIAFLPIDDLRRGRAVAAIAHPYYGIYRGNLCHAAHARQASYERDRQ